MKYEIFKVWFLFNMLFSACSSVLYYAATFLCYTSNKKAGFANESILRFLLFTGLNSTFFKQANYTRGQLMIRKYGSSHTTHIFQIRIFLVAFLFIITSYILNTTEARYSRVAVRILLISEKSCVTAYTAYIYNSKSNFCLQT